MNDEILSPLSLVLASSMLLLACGGQRAPTAAPSEAASSAPAADEALPESAAVMAEEKEGTARRAPGAQKKAASRADAAGPQIAPAPASDDADENWQRLGSSVRAFDADLQPSQLSCSGAKPHRDAICSIAERICELSSPGPSTTGPGSRCSEAQKSCDDAKSRYKARCGD